MDLRGDGPEGGEETRGGDEERRGDKEVGKRRNERRGGDGGEERSIAEKKR